MCTCAALSCFAVTHYGWKRDIIRGRLSVVIFADSTLSGALSSCNMCPEVVFDAEVDDPHE